MAKETKIALLIGLAFIIAFGFLLARQDDATRQQNDQQVGPPAGVLAQTDGPLGGHDGPPARSETVWHREDGEDRLVQSLHVGPDAAQPPGPAVQVDPAIDPAADPQAINITDITDHGPAVPPMIGALSPPAPLPPQPQASPARWYTVEVGDNLTRIARKFYGAENGEKWRLILEANPTRIPSPEGLRPRVRIKIPPLPGRPQPAHGGVVPIMALAPAPAPAAPAAPRAVAVRTYVVQVGDTLCGIAGRELGSATAYERILEWNRDVIRDANSIRPGMELKLGPAAPSVPSAAPAASPSPLIVGGGRPVPFDVSAVGNERLKARLERLRPVLMRMAVTSGSLIPEQREQLAVHCGMTLSSARQGSGKLMLALGASEAEVAEIHAIADELKFPWNELAAAERPHMTAEQRDEAAGRVLLKWLPTCADKLALSEPLRGIAQSMARAAEADAGSVHQAMQAALLRQVADPRTAASYVPIPREPSAPPAPSPPARSAPRGGFYIVQYGDTLSAIASAKLGSAGRWRDLLRWNRDVLSEPRLLRPGLRLRLSAPPGGGPAPPAPAGAPAGVRAATAEDEDSGEIVG